MASPHSPDVSVSSASSSSALSMLTVFYRGREWPLAQLAKKHGIDRRTLHSRLERGMSIEDALKAPLRPYPSNVSRPREPKHPPIEETMRERSLCDRCGDDYFVRPIAFGSGWKLCKHCREAAVTVVRDWVSCGP